VGDVAFFMQIFLIIWRLNMAEIKHYREFLLNQEREIFLAGMRGQIPLEQAMHQLAETKSALASLRDRLVMLNIRQLKQLAVGSGIRYYSRLRKAELVMALSS
jgi:hypothetical protein